MISRKKHTDISKSFSVFQKMKQTDTHTHTVQLFCCNTCCSVGRPVGISIGSSPDVFEEVTQVTNEQSNEWEREIEREKIVETEHAFWRLFIFIVFYRWVRRTCPKLIAAIGTRTSSTAPLEITYHGKRKLK